jgi:hypothetical protein
MRLIWSVFPHSMVVDIGFLMFLRMRSLKRVMNLQLLMKHITCTRCALRVSDNRLHKDKIAADLAEKKASKVAVKTRKVPCVA